MRYTDHAADDSLVLLLNGSAPATPLADAVTDEELHALAREHHEFTRPRRATRVAVGLGAVAVLLGAGGAAYATGALEEWLPWWYSSPQRVVSVSDDSDCEIRMQVAATGDPDFDATVERILNALPEPTDAEIREAADHWDRAPGSLEDEIVLLEMTAAALTENLYAELVDQGHIEAGTSGPYRVDMIGNCSALGRG